MSPPPAVVRRPTGPVRVCGRSCSLEVDAERRAAAAARAERISGDRANRQLAGDPVESTAAAVGSHARVAATGDSDRFGDLRCAVRLALPTSTHPRPTGSLVSSRAPHAVGAPAGRAAAVDVSDERITSRTMSARSRKSCGLVRGAESTEVHEHIDGRVLIVELREHTGEGRPEHRRANEPARGH